MASVLSNRERSCGSTSLSASNPLSSAPQLSAARATAQKEGSTLRFSHRETAEPVVPIRRPSSDCDKRARRRALLMRSPP